VVPIGPIALLLALVAARDERSPSRLVSAAAATAALDLLGGRVGRLTLMAVTDIGFPAALEGGVAVVAADHAALAAPYPGGAAFAGVPHQLIDDPAAECRRAEATSRRCVPQVLGRWPARWRTVVQFRCSASSVPSAPSTSAPAAAPRRE
jgi:hypothetical protein